MAVLSETHRGALHAEYMRELSALAEATGLSKAALRAALDAADEWAEANAPAFNQALPQPARGALTARQKARLLMFVIRRRFEVS